MIPAPNVIGLLPTVIEPANAVTVVVSWAVPWFSTTTVIVTGWPGSTDVGSATTLVTATSWTVTSWVTQVPNIIDGCTVHRYVNAPIVLAVNVYVIDPEKTGDRGSPASAAPSPS